MIARGLDGAAGMGEDDRGLVARVAAGDRDALAALDARHRRPLFAYLLLLAPDRGTAEELLQDTLVAAWRGAGRFEGRSSVRSWLFAIARRQAATALRRRALPLAGEEALAAVPTTEAGPEALALAGAARADLVAALRAVAPVHREVLAVTLGHGLSYEETAAVLGVPVGTVKSRLSNARRALRALLPPDSRG